MVNNVQEDGRQLFLTAYHCVGTSDTTDNLLLFNYQTPRCNDTETQVTPRSMTAHGLKKLVQWKQSDFSLLELQESIPSSYNVYLSGWTADLESIPSRPVVIHHPSADVKKISFHHGNCTQACWGWCNVTRGDPADHWQVDRWSKGTTEPGSSGSPLFDGQTKRIVGQLHGGSASCSRKDGYDMFGKLTWSFDMNGDKNHTLKPVLDSAATGIRFVDGANLNDLRRRVPRFRLQKV